MRSCTCPDPPGGTTMCEENQIAFCIVQNGKAVQRCVTPIPARNSLELVNWVLSIITGMKKSVDSPVNPYEINILKSGRYEMGEIQATFSLPVSVTDAIEEITNDLGGHQQQDLTM